MTDKTTTPLDHRVAAMLARRALDIPADPAGPDGAGRPLPALRPLRPVDGVAGPTPPPRRGRPLLAVAAGVVGLAAVGLAGAIRGISDGTSSGETVALEAGGATEQTTRPTTPAESTTDDAAARETDGGSMPATTVDQVVALLPDAVDARHGSMLTVPGRPESDPGAVAARYLAARLGERWDGLEVIDDDGLLHLFRWSAVEEGAGAGPVVGWVLVRVDPERTGVVASTTDGVTWPALDRSGDRLTATMGEVLDGELYVDVTDLLGEPVPGALYPDGQGGPGTTPFGTAGFTDGADRVEIDAAVPPWPVALRAQHVGGVPVTIAEVAIDPPGFAEPCGPVPPVTIDVGDRLGPLTAGPSGESSIGPVSGQAVWHHTGTEASARSSIEIRWPADPGLVGRLGLASLSSELTAQFALGPGEDTEIPGMRVTGENHAVVAVGSDPAADACDLVQLSVLGDPATSSWWIDALTGQWSFDLPLSVATPDLDPLLGPDGGGDLGGADPGSGGDQLVVDATRGDVTPDHVPRVPEQGSCDGLPDDPPRTGTGDGTLHPTSSAALADFVEGVGAALDPPMPTTGYEAYPLRGMPEVVYVNGYDDMALVVVTVTANGEGWSVTAWEAAPC